MALSRLWRKARILLEMIKFEHTIFALPFAYLGAVLGNWVVEGGWPTWREIGWVTVAMVGARSAAMALNRLIDRHIDAANPRTAGRALPAGLVTVPEVLVFIAVSFALLFYAAVQLNPLAVKLLPIAVFVLVIYSYTKRFTWLCHLVLGIALGLAPMGGWVATTGRLDGPAILLGLTVAFWTAGFDIIYACQDADFDRQAGLYSIPSRFGIARGLAISRFFHALTMLGLVALFLWLPLKAWFFAGIVAAGLILVYEHRLVSPHDLSRLNTAFFTMNGVLSVVVFLFTLLDLVMVE